MADQKTNQNNQETQQTQVQQAKPAINRDEQIAMVKQGAVAFGKLFISGMILGAGSMAIKAVADHFCGNDDDDEDDDE